MEMRQAMSVHVTLPPKAIDPTPGKIAEVPRQSDSVGQYDHIVGSVGIAVVAIILGSCVYFVFRYLL